MHELIVAGVPQNIGPNQARLGYIEQRPLECRRIVLLFFETSGCAVSRPRLGILKADYPREDMIIEIYEVLKGGSGGRPIIYYIINETIFFKFFAHISYLFRLFETEIE